MCQPQVIKGNLLMKLMMYISVIHPESGSGFILITENKCTCETLTLECNVIGSGSTVLSLQGSLTTCDNPSEIILLHSRYNMSSGAKGRTVCYNGAIELVGQSLRVEDNCFTSQLQIKFNGNLAENLVNCIYDNGTAEKVVGNYLIPSIHEIGKIMIF